MRPTKDEFLCDLPTLAYHLEMPTGSFSVFPLYRLSKAARQGGYKVVLSGEGADELFGGYARNEFLLARTLDPSDQRVAQYMSMLTRFDGTGSRSLLPHGVALWSAGRGAPAVLPLQSVERSEVDGRQHVLRRVAGCSFSHSYKWPIE